MLSQGLNIPTLHGNLLEGLVIDKPLPAPPLAKQDPIGAGGITGEAHLTELPQGPTRFKHPQPTTHRITHQQMLKRTLQSQELQLIAGCAQGKPTQ